MKQRLAQNAVDTEEGTLDCTATWESFPVEITFGELDLEGRSHLFDT